MPSLNSRPYSPPVQPSLVQQLETFARLELPQANYTPPLSSIDHYVAGVPTGALVNNDTRSLHPPLPLMRHSNIAYSNPGSDYQRPLQDQVDVESSCSGSNNLPYTAFATSTESSGGSPEGDDYHQQQSSASTGQEYHGPKFERPWGQEPHYMSRYSGLHGTVDPDLTPNGFVCPRAVHISPCGEDRSQEGRDDSIEDDDENGYRYPQTETIAYQQCYDRYYPYDQPHSPIGVFQQQYNNSLNRGHSCSSAPGSGESSPTRMLKLKTIKNRRGKYTQEMMKPFTQTLR